MSDTQAEPRRTRLSAVWLIPLAAALIGLWLVFSLAAVLTFNPQRAAVRG